jgi:succinate dehydrogenase / fumarate reductase flavoprotein subunit
MQGLADGYFVAPYTITNYLGDTKLEKVSEDSAEAKEALSASEAQLKKLLNIKGKKTVTHFHRELGKVMWDYCGMARNATGLKGAIAKIQEIREEFWQNVNVPGSGEDLNQQLEHANRTADFLELGELMCRDALMREESCGGHFREEHQTEEGEAKRDDENFAFVGAWEYKGANAEPALHKEPLTFEYVKPAQRSYK